MDKTTRWSDRGDTHGSVSDAHPVLTGETVSSGGGSGRTARVAPGDRGSAPVVRRRPARRASATLWDVSSEDLELTW